MHLVQSYATKTSSKISKPFILEKYYPILSKKYITLNTTSKESKSYSYWQNVIDEILPILKRENIDIVQIGAANETPMPGCEHTMGKTTINNVAYIVKNSIGCLGVDSFPVHMASNYGKKICALYSNNFIRNVMPFFSKSEDIILIEPEREKDEKPSFAITGDKSIDTIKPEHIASSILKLLGLSYKPTNKTLFIGNFYNNKMVHSIPNQLVNVAHLGVQSLIMRMDIDFNEDNLVKQLNVCPCSILTNKPINTNLLRNFKPRILEIIYFIDKNHSPEFVKALHDLKLPYKLITEMSEDELNKIKLDYIDYHIMVRKDVSVPKQINDKKNLQYKSNQFFLGRGQIYQSEYSYLKDKPLESFNNLWQDVDENDLNLLLKDRDFVYISEKNID